MLIKKPSDIKSSEITPEWMYQNRRQFILAASGAAASLMAPGLVAGAPQSGRKKGPYDTDETVTPEKDATSYNNFYEFGTDKEEPGMTAGGFKAKPWTVAVEGLVKKPQVYNFEDLIKGLTMEDRIYRMRCVEGWSMVIPWMGFPLADLIRRLEPTPQAKFVEFTTLYDPKRMWGQTRGVLKWPYVEGLRMDEATNPLTLFVIGLYGKPSPPQNGAPLRLITPWKYGFKGIKSIVKIKFTDTQPKGTWEVQTPWEYGFYANVNPNVDHPRWTQAKEARLDGSFFGGLKNHKTLMFNGYGQYVERMYAGMDLRENF